jgi:HAD superfamily hydrolase (TIGR01509 family)
MTLGPHAAGTKLTARDGLRAVLFDWDGTLVDSAEKSYRCYVKVFSAYGIVYDRATFARTYSPDWYRTYVEIGLPREVWAEADARWLDCYDTEPSRLFPGARVALERLAERGIVQGVVSSGDPRRVRRELVTLGVDSFFAVVVCGGETAERKPHPEPLLLALDRLAIRPAEAAYVGDSPEDVLMAKSAGTFAVGVPGGFPNGQALAAAEPHVLSPSIESAVSALLR